MAKKQPRKREYLAQLAARIVAEGNLQVRMRNRGFTRLTDAFSRKLENMEHSVAVQVFVYNFITPARYAADAAGAEGGGGGPLVDL